MAVAHYFLGDSITTNDTGLNTGGSITLTGANTNVGQRIGSISISAAGTITAFNVQVTKNDGTTIITQFGGQVGGAATGPMGPGPYQFTPPINCVVNDNAKVIVTATGATAGTVCIAANYTLAAK